jgi:uncharacterized protein (TIGR03435 family)
MTCETNPGTEDIMTNNLAQKSSSRKRVLLTAAGLLGLAGPIAFGGLYPSHAEAQQAQTQAGQGAHPSWDRSRPREKFEAASIKPVGPGSMGLMRIRQFSPGRFSVDNAPLRRLIQGSFGARSWEISVVPSWVSSAYYAIDAKATGPASVDAMWRMLVPLFEDRFKMKWHSEMRVMPVYVLSVAKNGPRLPKPQKGSCAEVDRRTPPSQAGPGKRLLFPCGSTGMPLPAPGRAELYGGQVQMPALVDRLIGILDRPVIDKTGFTAPFDLQMEFAFQPSRRESPDDPAGAPHISTALKQQLGLRIDSDKAPVEVIVIDSIEKPSPN